MDKYKKYNEFKKFKKHKRNQRIVISMVWIVITAAVAVIAAVYCGSFGAGFKKVKGFTPYDEKNPGQSIVLSEEEITLDAIGLYSGQYVEDGSDEEIQDVVAALFTNHSDQMLQIAEIEIQVGGDTALFRITNVPAGASVFAQDMNRLKGVKEQKATYISDASKYFEEVSMQTKKFSAEGTDGRLILKNKTAETYPCVYVYYKTQLTKDIYMGGITYRVPFEEVPGETQVDSDAGHFSKEYSEIVDIQVIENSQSDISPNEE